MIIENLARITDGKFATKSSSLTRMKKGGCGADLMSNVLASIQPDAVLLTKICNPQVVMTTQIPDEATITLVQS